MAEPTEDLPYHVSDHAMADPAGDNSAPQDDHALVLSLLEYCDTEIAKHNSFDVLELPQNATPAQKIAAFDEMAIHKGVAMHLRNIKQEISNKAKGIDNV
ncbi:MAG TPA: hypothetical protein VD907_06970 [Verrucomicrobiae bacterium]|nr:hypothetical protein [Verrucomicrobiae bacterium]